MFRLMSLGVIVFSIIVGILILGLIIVLLYAQFKYLKLINHPKPVLAFIPVVGMCVMGDTVITDNKGDVHFTKKFSMPKTLFMCLPVISVLIGFFPFIGGLISYIIILAFSFVLNVDMLKRLKNTQNFNEVQFLAILSLVIGIIPPLMVLFRGSNANEILPKYSGRFNGGLTGDINAFFSRYSGSSNNNKNNQDYSNFNQYSNNFPQNTGWGNQNNQSQWGQQNPQAQWGNQNTQTQWGNQSMPSQWGNQDNNWGQQSNSWDNQSQWGSSQNQLNNQQQIGWGNQNNQSQWGNSQNQLNNQQQTGWDNQWSSQHPITPQDSNWGDNMSNELDYASEFASGDTDNNRGWQ